MGNTFGKLFRVTTFGESHGAALGCIIDGCPAGLAISAEDIQAELRRRRPGQSAVTTSRNEADAVKILSGIFEGKTLGTPIAMLVENADHKSADYSKLKDVFRPGHADFVWETKYGLRDYRGGGRSSGRETVARVMAGAVAKKLLAEKSIRLYAFARQIGPIVGKKVDVSFIEKNPVRAADPLKAGEMEAYIARAKEEGDSVGGVVELHITGLRVGLGEPVFDKLNADLAKAIVSIPTVKGIEFGAGFAAALKRGSENNDPLHMREGAVRAEKNDAGGISGGISNGEDIIIRIAVKPPSSISREQHTVTTHGAEVPLKIEGRHDPCIVPRFIPVAESMAAIVLADHLLRLQTAKIATLF